MICGHQSQTGLIFHAVIRTQKSESLTLKLDFKIYGPGANLCLLKSEILLFAVFEQLNGIFRKKYSSNFLIHKSYNPKAIVVSLALNLM